MNFRISLLLICLLLSSSEVLAQSCSINVTPVAFGNLDGIPGVAVDSTGSISVDCDSQVSYLIRIDAGQYSSGGFSDRKMQQVNGTVSMKYNLYRDSSRALIWGDGTGGSSVVSGVSPGVRQDITVYGRIFGGQNLMMGDYRDSVTVIVEW